MQNIIFVGFLGRKYSLVRILGCSIFALLELCLNHINNTLEPLGQKNSILSTARFAQIGLGKAHLGSFLFECLLQPLWLFFILGRNARLCQLVCEIVQRLKELFTLCRLIFLDHSLRRLLFLFEVKDRLRLFLHPDARCLNA